MRLKARAQLYRRLAKAVLGRDVPYRAEVHLPARSLGSDYGGWVVHTERLAPDSVVYSFGVGRDTTFELDLISQLGLIVHAFDPTPRAVEWVRAQDMPTSFVFHPVGIADYDGTATFEAPLHPEWDSYTLMAGEGDKNHQVSADVQRLTTITKDLGHHTIDVLKLDVEGAEYGALADIVASDIVIRQLLVEFHHRFQSVGIDQTKQTVELLRRNGFKLFYVSPNGEEFSFIHQRELPAA